MEMISTTIAYFYVLGTQQEQEENLEHKVSGASQMIWGLLLGNSLFLKGQIA
jgi:hypothetical protein